MPGSNISGMVDHKAQSSVRFIPRGWAKSEPARRYISSTALNLVKPYVSPEVCDMRCHKRICSVAGTVTGLSAVPLR